MKIRNIAMIGLRTAEPKLTGVSQTTCNARLDARFSKRSLRFSLPVVFLALLIGVFLSVLSVSPLAKSLRHQGSRLSQTSGLSKTKATADKTGGAAKTGRL